MKRSTRMTLTGYAFAAPWLMAMVFLIGYPFAASLFFSTCEYPPLRGPVFIGAGNYQELMHDAVFRESMLVTIIFAMVAIPLGVILALTLALFLNSRIRGRSVYRVVYYLPHLVPTVAVAILWMWIFNPQFGILNVALMPFGKVASVLLRPFAIIKPNVTDWLGLLFVIATFVLWRWLKRLVSPLSQRKIPSLAKREQPSYSPFGKGGWGDFWIFGRLSESGVVLLSRLAGILFAAAILFALAVWINPSDLTKIQSPGWLTDANPFPSGLSVAPSWALWALIYMSLWGVGQMAIIYLAKLQDVPIVLYEVADLDGANWWQKTRYITLPMISPVILFNVVMGIIGAFQVFTEPYIMTSGGPEDRTRFVAMFIYDQTFQYQRLGYSSAVAWVLFLVIVALTLLALRISREHVYYAAR
jgi:ABC-type sugar transport system permease subunit